MGLGVLFFGRIVPKFRTQFRMPVHRIPILRLYLRPDSHPKLATDTRCLDLVTVCLKIGLTLSVKFCCTLQLVCREREWNACGNRSNLHIACVNLSSRIFAIESDVPIPFISLLDELLGCHLHQFSKVLTDCAFDVACRGFRISVCPAERFADNLIDDL